MSVKQKSSLSCDRHIAPDCDRCVLNLLHLQMMQTEDDSTSSQIQPLLRQFQQVVDQEGVISLAIICIKQAEQRLLIRLIPDSIGEQSLLLLEEQELPSFSIVVLRSLGLTEREAEVLFWVAKDKSNAAIAKILDCCEGTVRKHLEHLYKKLEVQTRTGAVMAALARLGLLQV